MRLFRILIGVCLFLVLSSPINLPGYVLPGEYVIELMLEHINMPGRMAVHQEVELPDLQYQDRKEGDSGAPIVYRQLAQYFLPGQFRSEIENDLLSRVHVTSAGSSVTVVDNILVSETEEWKDLYKDLFLFHSRQSLSHRLSRLGVDTDISSLGRMDTTLCYVIGARYPDLRKPQLWIEKKFFRPVRWVLIPSASGIEPPAAEIRFSRWRRIDQTWFPAEITLFEYGRPVRHIRVGDVEINPPFPSDLFDIESVKKKSLKEPPPLLKEDSSSEIQQQIEQFNKLYE